VTVNVKVLRRKAYPNEGDTGPDALLLQEEGAEQM
jgi:hypothetical protein